MAFKKLFSFYILVVLGLPGLAYGQLHVPGPRFQHHDIESPDSTRPVATPGIYNYDMQIFAPVEFPTGDELEPNTGFFFSIDRMTISFSGGNEFGGKHNNYTWGNRYDFGFMNDEDDGWNFIYEDLEGSDFVNGADVLSDIPVIVNPTQLTSRLGNVEINKIYRQVLKNGGWLEPYIGLRYIHFSDNTTEDRNDLGFLGFPTTRFTQNLSNDAIGLNIGGKLVKRRGRWRISNDIAISTLYNQQDFHAADSILDFAGNTFFDEQGDSDNAFVPVLDYRFELAYNVTRDFGIRGGATVMYLWDGIVRANSAQSIENPNSIFGFDDAFGGVEGLDGGGLVENRLLAAGFSFGMEYRR